MFSTMNNQKKAQSLIEEAKEAVEGVDAAFSRLKENLISKMADVDRFRNHLVTEAMPKLVGFLERIKNEPEVTIRPISDQPLASQVDTLFQRAEAVEPARLEAVDRGKGGAFFKALTAVVIVVAAALLIAAVGVGLPLEPASFAQPSNLVRMLKWLGGGAFNMPTASAAWGGAGLALVAVGVWMLVSNLAMGKASKRNLKAAERSLKEAERYAAEKKRYVDAAEKLDALMEETALLMEATGIYCDEFNAVLRRIVYVEGDDFEGYAPRSKESVRRAAECAEALSAHLDMALVTTEGMVADSLERHVQTLRRIVSALNKGETFEPIIAGEVIENEVIILPYDKQKPAEKETEEDEVPEENKTSEEEPEVSPEAKQEIKAKA